MSISKVILLIKFCNFNIGHNLSLRGHTNFIGGTYMYLEEPHIMVLWFSRSRSHVEVKGHFIEIPHLYHWPELFTKSKYMHDIWCTHVSTNTNIYTNFI